MENKYTKLGDELIISALRNIKEISLYSPKRDFTDPDEFIDKNIKGIHVT